MSKDSAEKVTGSSRRPDNIEISYCPTLGLYHYKRSDGDEFCWTNEQLERSLETCIQDGKVVEAEWMSRVTTAAREVPHKVVVFHSDGSCKITDPVVPGWVPRPLHNSEC